MNYSSLTEETNCRICKTEQESDIVLSYKDLELSKCKECGAIFASRRLKKELIDRFYAKYIPSAFTDMEREEFRERGEKKLKERVEDAEYQLTILYKYVEEGKLLDVGAAGGTFLDIARKHGWSIRGTELSDNCVKIARLYYKINLFKGGIEDFRERGFDAVVLWNVLEHLYEPYDEILHLRKLLNKGGIILIKVPNPTLEILKKDPQLPGHVFNFNLESLKYLFDKTGFEILEAINGYDGELPTLVVVARNIMDSFFSWNVDEIKALEGRRF